MLRFIKIVPPWVWMFGASITATAIVGAFAWTYAKGIQNAMASVKEQIFERTQWIAETNVKFEREQIKRDASFQERLKQINEEWK